MTLARSHVLPIKRVSPLAAGAVALTLPIPTELREVFRFVPGQFLTLGADFQGRTVWRNYSICSSTRQLAQWGEVEVAIKPVTGGVFSNWVTTLRPGDMLKVMPPDGRFGSGITAGNGAVHRVAFAAGSGITPILSILRSSLMEDPGARFSLVYCNQRVDSIMFLEELQDLKDSFAQRLNLIHVLTRQATDCDLLHGRLDRRKLGQLLEALLPAQTIDEVLVCGPPGMIETVEQGAAAAGITADRIHSERFTPADSPATRPPRQAPGAVTPGPLASEQRVLIVLDGKTHDLPIGADEKLLDVGLAAGLDLPYACRGGVCCTCRARVLQGSVHMEKNFTLEQWEIDRGFCLSCQARALTPRVTLSYDDR